MFKLHRSTSNKERKDDMVELFGGKVKVKTLLHSIQQNKIQVVRVKYKWIEPIEELEEYSIEMFI